MIKLFSQKILPRMVYSKELVLCVLLASVKTVIHPETSPEVSEVKEIAVVVPTAVMPIALDVAISQLRPASFQEP
jgi:hypothetical protein